MRPEPSNVEQIGDEVADCLRTWGEEAAVVARARRTVIELLAGADPSRAMRFDLSHRPGQVELRVTQSETIQADGSARREP